MATLTQRLRALSPHQLVGMRRGVEKESLRVLRDGALALTPHAQALGSALTHPHITTDFSESQLELITGVHGSAQACLDELREIHQFVYRAIGDEMLWVGSMPGPLPADETIPIGRYGTSNVGRAKSVYRQGLSHRYGRRMQTISGIHYNWSVPGLSNDDYFGLIRNFRRHAFVLLLLLGATPAVCRCFVEGRDHGLQALSDDTYGLPHATSLRMGRLGYQSDAQSALAVSYNGLDSYAASLHDALTRPHAPYELIGIRNPGGEYNQLATTLLQIENEFYSTIRPKRVIFQGERPLHALRERGVEYVEVRCIDLNPYAPFGLDADTMRLLDLFLMHCLLSDSPPDTPAEIAALGRNQHRTAAQGRDPALRLERGTDTVPAADWAREILRDCAPIADALDALDATGGGQAHAAVLAGALAALDDPQRLPSARVMAEMTASHGASHARFVGAMSAHTREAVLAQRTDPAAMARLQAQCAESVRDQVRIESLDSLPFEIYRQEYLSPRRLVA